ncbi:MAG: ABC transporter substrate-binding protein, partial [Agromyces sp.]|nr:ABC transporter substrate-binding protein [Agromyces sp.]
MRFSRKLLGTAAVGAAVALLATGCAGGSGGSGASEPAAGSEYEDVLDVNFGYIPDFNGTSLLAVAEDQGLWDKYGLDVTATSVTNGPLQIQALGTGDLDFGYIGPGAMWLPASGQAKVVAITTLGQAD